MNFPDSAAGLSRYVTTLTPAAALATPTGVIWYSDSTNRSAGSDFAPVVDEIIGPSFSCFPLLPINYCLMPRASPLTSPLPDLALDFFRQYDRSSLILFSTVLTGTYAALLTTDNRQPPPSAALAIMPPPQNLPNAITLAVQMVPGVADHYSALVDILRDLKRGWRKELRWLGQTPQEGILRFWVSFRDGSKRACDGFNRMEQRPFEDQTEDL